MESGEQGRKGRLVAFFGWLLDESLSHLAEAILVVLLLIGLALFRWGRL